MRYFLFASKCALVLLLMSFAAGNSLAQDESNTEITGFYQQYRNFSFNLGSGFAIPETHLTGGGFNITQNFTDWFGLFTQFSFYGKVGQSVGLPVRIINNQQGPRWQTKQHGPFRLYVKGGLGFSHFGFDNIGSDTKLSLAYGGGVQVWFAKSAGLTLDLSHVLMGLPNLTGAQGRDKWDSGLVFTPGVSIRF